MKTEYWKRFIGLGILLLLLTAGSLGRDLVFSEKILLWGSTIGAIISFGYGLKLRMLHIKGIKETKK